MQKIFAAHISEDGRVQTNKNHLEGTASLSRNFAERFDSGDYGYICGLLHDIGKYSQEFQARIRGSNKKVDHSTAGAIETNKMLPGLGWLMSYCISGHHTGLLNGGSIADVASEPTLNGRIKKTIPDYSLFRDDIDIITAYPKGPPPIKVLGEVGFSTSFYARMLFSCLVDADFLNTESFMSVGKIDRSINYEMKDLLNSLYEHIAKFDNPKEDINIKRSDILRTCLDKALKPRGLFTLTVPTGGGKTISSLAFALRHAVENKMERIIYVIPYTSIIEQNAAIFKKIISKKYIIEHHSNFNYDDENEEMTKQRYATENWDIPIVVTTNVQFFESLFANKTSKCRKLHNTANSVIIFDEAQMLPTCYLLPCVRAISELVHNYKSTAVLCSATQPALAELFPKELMADEICENVSDYYNFFKRNKIVYPGQLSDENLSREINIRRQSLCIVNTRRQAQNLYSLLDSDGRYHLSTLMCPKHRSEILAEIRNRLSQKLSCRVVSTSLIEAGVDLDFPVVFREMAGLDSQIQAAGRCNREGKNDRNQSNVYIFESDEKYNGYIPSAFKRPIEIARIISRQFNDVTSPEAIHEYFRQLYKMEGEGLDAKKIVERLEEGAKYDLSFPFADIASEFCIIEEVTYPIIIVRDENIEQMVRQLEKGAVSRKILREIQPYVVNVYEKDFSALEGAGLVRRLDDEISVLCDMDRYSEATGLDVVVEEGMGLFG